MINDDTLAIFLMHFGSNYNSSTLSPQSIFKVLQHLYKNGLTPSRLFNPLDDAFYYDAELSFLEADALKILHKLYFQAKNDINRLQHKGVSILSLVDAEYPRKLKATLKYLTPPILFYSGDIEILSQKSIAIVGIREALTSDLSITKRLAALSAQENIVVVSGGANGVDYAAQSSALMHNGKVAIFYPFCLTKKISDNTLANNLTKGNLLLLSHTIPYSSFSSNNALTRNRFIHSSGDFAIAVNSKLRKGGTWSGSLDNLKNHFSPLFVCDTPSLGNIELIKMGATPLNCTELFNNSINLYDYLNNHHK